MSVVRVTQVVLVQTARFAVRNPRRTAQIINIGYRYLSPAARSYIRNFLPRSILKGVIRILNSYQYGAEKSSLHFRLPATAELPNKGQASLFGGGYTTLVADSGYVPANVAAVFGNGDQQAFTPHNAAALTAAKAFKAGTRTNPTSFGAAFAVWERPSQTHYRAIQYAYWGSGSSYSFISPEINNNQDYWFGVVRTLDPSIVPPLVGAPAARPISYRMAAMRVNHFPWTKQQRQAGNTVDPLPSVSPVVDVPPYGVPFVYPPTVVSSDGKKMPSPSFHVRMPPPRGTKEVKVKVLSTALKLAGRFTEGTEAVDVLYRALPDAYKPRYKDTRYRVKHPTLLQKMEAVYKHLDKVDIPDAVQGLIVNEIQDRFIGKAARQLKAVGRPYGANLVIRRPISY